MTGQSMIGKISEGEALLKTLYFNTKAAKSREEWHIGLLC